MSTCKRAKGLSAAEELTGKGCLCCLASGQMMQIKEGTLQDKP